MNVRTSYLLALFTSIAVIAVAPYIIGMHRPGGKSLSSRTSATTPAKDSTTSTIMTFFVEHQPVQEPKIVQEIKKEKMRTLVSVKEIKRRQLRQFEKPRAIPGVQVVYMGSTTHSDHNGQIFIGRQHGGDTLTFLITPAIRPVLLDENLVSHFKVGTGQPAQWYSLTRTKNPKDKKWYWSVTKTTPPSGSTIPLETITILADPSHVYLDEGSHVTIKGSNFFLPTVYVQPGDHTGKAAIPFIDFNRYFATTDYVKKFSNERYAQVIQP